MTKFETTKFRKSGDFLLYNDEVIARFKHGGMAHFRSFMTKNFTVEEYFDKMNNTTLAPMEILEQKGYVSFNVSKVLKKLGYPVTQQGLSWYLLDQANGKAA
jgi:hypothetical protein